MNDPVAPADEAWQGLDPNFLRLKRLMICLVWPILFAAPTLALVVTTRWWWTIGVAVPVAAVWIWWRWWRQGRVFSRWGYAERDTDLYIRKGLMWRSLTIVPYGRMQVVEVSAGPLARAFGVASVKLVTASLQSNAEIPGLNAETAAQLRDRLAEKGTTQQAGL